jgi:hypothetical protein
MALSTTPAEIDPRTRLVAKEMGPMFERAFTSTAERPGWTLKTVGADGPELTGPLVIDVTGREAAPVAAPGGGTP